MDIAEIPVDAIDISAANVRKNLDDGEIDVGISDLASSIERQGLLSPITVYKGEGGRYALVAGQRRLLAMKQLRRSTIAAIVRDAMSDDDATVVSLVENVHRADMNPLDKAHAFKKLLDHLGTLQAVFKETGVGAQTIKKYVQLLGLAPELQRRLSAGEATATTALARLAQTVKEPEAQLDVYRRIGGFTQDVQTEILSEMDPDRGNLEDLVDQAHAGVFETTIVRVCPRDCPHIPESLKPRVEALLKEHAASVAATL